jgi:hypothetical protein
VGRLGCIQIQKAIKVPWLGTCPSDSSYAMSMGSRPKTNHDGPGLVFTAPAGDCSIRNGFAGEIFRSMSLVLESFLIPGI